MIKVLIKYSSMQLENIDDLFAVAAASGATEG